MRNAIFAFGLAAGLATNLAAGDTLRLKLEPEREFVLSGSPQEVVVKIDLTAAGHKKKAKRTPLNVAVVLDRSGSMTGAKIEKARQAAMGLVDQLAPGDYFSLIAYSDQAEVLVPAQELEDKEAVKLRISRIRLGGSTALYAGVELGATQIQRHLSSRRINRVILLSDGLANVGPSSTQDLRQLGHALSERADIVAQKELLLTAVAKDTALADADSGRYKQAAVTLNRQAIVLDQQCLNAPASVQSQLRQEAENLRLRASQLEQNQYDSGTRKAMQSESWNARNSK